MTATKDRERGAGRRRLAERVRTAKGRKASSTRWLERHLNDPFVAEAKRLGLRSRAAFKLIDIDRKVGLLKRGRRVVDLGAAPGGWTQVVAERVGPKGVVVAVDLADMAPVPGARILKADFLAAATPSVLRRSLGGPADVVLSDLAPAASGHRETDHFRIMGLAEAALAFALEALKPQGVFVVKLLQGGGMAAYLAELKRHFTAVRSFKPAASRAESAEFYVVATGFKGPA
ncbi:MAG: RlmE family RNA methyltransferase [Pseudomonadota bacterium]